jgi:transcriptional regulator with XRE-family HTH domain
MVAMPISPGERVRAWRQLAGLSLAELCDRVDGLKVATLSKMELGQQRIPTSTMEAIAAALGQPMYGEGSK